MMKTNIKKIILKDKYQILSVYDNNLNVDFLDKIANSLSFGIKIIEYVQTTECDRVMLENLKRIQQLTSIYGALLFVRKRLDIFEIIDADGIIITDDDIPVKYIKKHINSDKFIGYYGKNCNEGSDCDFIISKDKNNKTNLTVFYEETTVKPNKRIYLDYKYFN